MKGAYRVRRAKLQLRNLKHERDEKDWWELILALNEIASAPSTGVLSTCSGQAQNRARAARETQRAEGHAGSQVSPHATFQEDNPPLQAKEAAAKAKLQREARGHGPRAFGICWQLASQSGPPGAGLPAQGRRHGVPRAGRRDP